MICSDFTRVGSTGFLLYGNTKSALIDIANKNTYWGLSHVPAHIAKIGICGD